MNSSRWLAAAAVYFVLLASAWAQATSGSSIAGQVVDQSNAAVARADVSLIESATSSRRTTTTNDVGRYVFTDVTPGTYEISISMTGYRTLHRVINVEQGEKVAIEESLTTE